MTQTQTMRWRGGGEVCGRDLTTVSLISERIIKRGWSLFCLRFLCENVMLRIAGTGTSLAVQWSRLYDLNSGDLGSIPGRGTRSRMPQQRSKILHALDQRSEIQRSQIHKLIFKNIFKKEITNKKISKPLLPCILKPNGTLLKSS